MTQSERIMRNLYTKVDDLQNAIDIALKYRNGVLIEYVIDELDDCWTETLRKAAYNSDKSHDTTAMIVDAKVKSLEDSWDHLHEEDKKVFKKLIQLL